MQDGDAPSPSPSPRVESVVPRGNVGSRVTVRPWVGIAANRGAGTGQSRSRVSRLVRDLRRRGLRPRIAWTPEDRSGLVAEAAGDPRARCFVAVGGDGTVAALVNDRPTVPITVLACGTENLFARHFRLGRCPRRLADTIEQGRVERIDLGATPERRFSLMAGFGFDADVVTRHHTARVAATGLPRPTNRAAYVEPVLRSSFGYRFPEMTVAIDDPGATETLTGTTVFVFNLPRYALGLPFAPTASGCDGLLDLVVFQKPGPWHALRYLWLVFRQLHLRRPGVIHRRVRRLAIAAAETVPVQLDGDPGGLLEPEGASAWTIEAVPAALGVLVPASYRG